MNLKLSCITLAACTCLFMSGQLLAGDQSPLTKYKPLFKVELDASSSTVAAAYLKAYHSNSPETAIKRWQAFVDEYAGDDSIQDMTDITLIRQSLFELMRLYYEQGRGNEADALLKKADDYTVYSVPSKAQAKQWCEANNFCK